MSNSQVPVPPPERMATVLSAIAAQARRTNLVRAAELRAALDRAASEGLDAADWAAAERTAHQLAGSAGTFGYAAVSELARSLERLLAQAGVAEVEPAELERAGALLDQVGDELAAEPDLA
ncbi:MAG TPA: Hpt domain-containing protein [Microlunatus sp.]|nr:Hpt domain-containing protein [Microlunatus sp.]